MPLFDEGSWRASSLYQVSRIKSVDIGIGGINQSRAMRIAQRRIEGFAQQFGEAHRNLARHAAFPLVLTPDLLYQIWANFVPQAPWTAVAHVLLSRLCRQVGYEMYEMDISDRNLLLRELKKEFRKERFDELGEFLLDYVAQRLTDDDVDTHDLREGQEWTALVYTKPDEAARELAEKLRSRVTQENITELLRLTSLVKIFTEPLAEAGFEPLLSYSLGIESFARENIEDAVKQQGKMLQENYVKVAGVTLPIPEQVKVSSVPDIWAHPLLTEIVLHNKNHPLHEQMIEQWRGMLAAIALAEVRRLPLAAEFIDLGELRHQDHFVTSLHKYIPSPTRTLYTLDGKNPWEEIYVFLWDKKPVGMTTPSTLVVPSEQGEWVGLSWWNSRDCRLESPNNHLNASEKALLWCWLDNLSNELYNHRGDPKAIDMISGLLNEFRDSLGSYKEQQLSLTNDPQFFGVQINRGVLTAINYPIKVQ